MFHKDKVETSANKSLLEGGFVNLVYIRTKTTNVVKCY